MSKVAIITDTTAYIPEPERKKHDIHAVALQVMFGEETYKEELELDHHAFFDKIREEEKLPTTSQPPIGDFLDLYQQLAETHDEAIVITLSSAISGTFQTAKAAAGMTDNLTVHVFDSEISCAAQGYYVYEAAEMANAGHSAQEILAHLEKMKATDMVAYFMVDDLNHLHRGGRLSSAQAFFGSLMKIKPILKFSDQRINPFEKIRTKKKGLQRLKELFAEKAGNGKKTKVFVIHANRPDEAETLKQELQAEHANATIEVVYFGAVIGTHVGEGTLGIGWYQPYDA